MKNSIITLTAIGLLMCASAARAEDATVRHELLPFAFRLDTSAGVSDLGGALELGLGGTYWASPAFGLGLRAVAGHHSDGLLFAGVSRNFTGAQATLSGRYALYSTPFLTLDLFGQAGFGIASVDTTHFSPSLFCSDSCADSRTTTAAPIGAARAGLELHLSQVTLSLATSGALVDQGSAFMITFGIGVF